MAMYGPACFICRSNECPGCEEGEFLDPELESLSRTPDALYPDGRDATPPPPVYLSPYSVLRNRERTRKYLATGDWTWPKHNSEAA